jgi:hypothetical protein
LSLEVVRLKKSGGVSALTSIPEGVKLMERRKAPKEAHRAGTLQSTRSAKAGSKKKTAKETLRTGTLQSTRSAKAGNKKARPKKETMRSS